MSLGKVGFACKYLHPDQTQKKKILEEIQRPLTEKCTTVRWLNSQHRDVAEQRLWDIMVHNSQAVYNLIEYVGSLPERQRMVRLGSNQLPCATQEDWRYFWKRTDVVDYANKYYSRAGELARQLGVRLSMHPGQFTVLASDNPEIVERNTVSCFWRQSWKDVFDTGWTFSARDVDVTLEVLPILTVAHPPDDIRMIFKLLYTTFYNFRIITC